MNALMSDIGKVPGPKLPQLGTPVDPLVGREVGGYVIEFALGEGGMGLVYQARHPFLDRRFAIKVLRPEFAANLQLSSNFVREAQTLSALKHPHIIDIVGFGPLDDQRQFMVMEFLDGRTLEEELKKGALPVSRALLLADQILDALEGAHSIGVIHRDLKPSNVFLAKVSGGTEVVKLLDFGLAKQQPQALSGGAKTASVAQSVISGTPDYIAPEQAVGGAVSKLSDLYSFGVVLFELLTGKKLFSVPDWSMDPIRELLLQHLNTDAPRIGPAFSEDLDQLVAELLRKDPKHRPQTVQVVRERLKRVAARARGAITSPLMDLAPLQVPRRQARWPLLVAVGAVVLLSVAVWKTGEGPVVAAPPPVVVVTPVPVPAPEVVQPKKLEEVDPLPALTKRPAVKREVTCEPTERWRASSLAHLQELQQLAASRSNGKLWARFEDAEAPLTASIGNAATSADCAAVEKQIHQLAKELSK